MYPLHDRNGSVEAGLKEPLGLRQQLSPLLKILLYFLCLSYATFPLLL